MQKNIHFIRKKHIRSGIDGPNVLLTAGVHGDEYEPMLTALDLVKELPRNLTNGSVTIVTTVNESAYSASTRYGSDGLDLARICPGNLQGTVSEIAAAQISSLIREADYFVDMHTGGLMYDIAPLAGYMLHPSSDILKKQWQMALAYDLPIIWGTDYRPNGRTLSVARDAGVPAIYLEYGGGSGIRWEVVRAYKDGFLNLLKSLGMIDQPVESQPMEKCYWVEDHRTNSGYLQGKMPAPADGIFISEIKLGEIVQKGQRWGKIVDPFNGNSVDVLADISGLAFLKRVIVKVKKGDALGGILPVEKPGIKVVYDNGKVRSSS
ncbi:succinylglutamate desuccinylase/aspartoacylase family protein [Dyadobacter frigoris]|uniref:Succinylglutamate desuccinylase n=1 Tax=Dyadobacter frigoris TaxID=2576211 RepID=A0A4U6CYS8_9BACT|nr:M14 family metallopeptidase [Dyadobacter frigoris]TKT88957.1 succinylglutamate desuccinylase [Dyadobacter frigoris]